MSEPRKFVKKQIVQEAIQWTGNNLRAVIDFTGWHESARSRWTWEEYEKVVAEQGLKIFTAEGPLKAPIGHWIVKGSKGEAWPVRPDYFDTHYEPAHLSAQPSPDAAEPRYHAVMQMLQAMQMEHGLCQPRSRRACTRCNAKDDLDAMLSAYKGAPATLSAQQGDAR